MQVVEDLTCTLAWLCISCRQTPGSLAEIRDLPASVARIPALSQGNDSPSQAASTARAAGPSGLGSSLPSRPGPSRASETSLNAPAAASAAPEALAFDPLKRGASAARPASRQQQQQQQQQPQPAQGRQLPPDVQRLADDLLRLVHESNIGEGRSSSPGQGVHTPLYSRLLGHACPGAVSPVLKQGCPMLLELQLVGWQWSALDACV